MRLLFESAKLFLLEMASTFFFLALFLLTHNVPLSVVLAVALGLAQIAWQFARGKTIETMEWLSLFVVVSSGAATLLTDDPRFVMIKPSVIYIVVGIVMLKPGWMNRYLPPIARDLVADLRLCLGSPHVRHGGAEYRRRDELQRCRMGDVDGRLCDG
jgi:intracellular septation protein A